MEITVDDKGKVTVKLGTTEDEKGNTVYLVEGTPIKATLQLVDHKDKDLKQGTLSLLDKDGNVVTTWVSDGGTYEFGHLLKAGENYTIHEDNPSEGYEGANDVKISVTDEGVVIVDKQNQDGEVVVKNVPSSKVHKDSKKKDNKNQKADKKKVKNKKVQQKNSSANQPPKDRAAGTGDDTPIALYLLLFLASLTGISAIAVLHLRRRRAL